MAFPAFIKTSFVISGLLGLRLENVPDGRGGFSSIEMNIPFKAGCTDQNLPIQISSLMGPLGFGRRVPAFNTKFSLFPSLNMNGNNKIPDSKTTFVNGLMNSKRDENPEVQNKKSPTSSTISSKKTETINNKFSSCKEAKCSKGEDCVTWMKKDATDQDSDPSSTSECLPNEDDYSQKIHPKEAKLCSEGKTHSIVYEAQPCLKKDPPCPLVWKYQCVNETESPHICSLKNCPFGGCIEQIRCEDQPPCIVDAVCLPSYLVQS